MVAHHQKPDQNEQIIDLETKLAFQEDSMQQLSDMVAQQQQDIFQLKGQMGQLIKELNTVLSDLREGASLGGGADATDQKPPHY